MDKISFGGYQVTMSTNEDKELLDLATEEIDGFDTADFSWADLYRLHGAISGILNRHQMLPRETVPINTDRK